jgi:putative membrane protein
MVYYNPKEWVKILFHNYSRQIMRTLTPAVLFLSVFSGLVCYLMLDVFRLHEADFHTTIAMHSLLGIVLGLFLVFRTNSAYDRWWEGRKLWGSLVNNTRNLALKISAFVPKEDFDTRNWFAQMIPNVPMALKEHLRNDANLTDLDLVGPGFKDEIEKVQHIPNRLVGMMYERFHGMYRENRISGEQYIMVDRELKEFSDIIGACERIKNTPIPYNYMMYIKKFIFLYLITLPFGFVTQSGYLTIPLVALISYILLSVELIAEEIEDPFGRDINDLPTDELAEKIKANVREILL